ncbi:MAG: hypothetical protein M1828_000187 [Chrysothrix sp. TS-e1954]|nr:MAG: hypothetical protein M1828_000187 [Chrysothrix sp. TS-e1954]
MASWSEKPAYRSIRLPRHRLNTVAKRLLSSSPSPRSTSSQTSLITVVCISDTHNTQPELPLGDLLIHAGDLSVDGSFDEIQTQLTWLSAQPHTHKIVIAGNHEVLLDPDFIKAHPERDYPSNRGRTSRDLIWRSVRYLQDESISLHFHKKDSLEGTTRTLNIYGSPWTPRYGLSAFQRRRGEDIWTDKVPSNTDVLVTHGPPYKHLDGALSSGCRYLAQEVERSRPRLVVFGHIHVGRGQEDIVFDGLRKSYESVRAGEAGWMTIMFMALQVLCTWLVPVKFRKCTTTTLVNAAVVSGDRHEYQHPSIVVKI